MKLWLDLETYSEVPIRNGTHAYAAGAEIMLLAWALDDGPISVIDFTNGDPVPPELMFPEYTEVWAHNSGFDRTVLSHAMPALCPPIHRWRDTMVQAFTHGLPGSLGALCDVLKVSSDKAKDKEGKKLIRRFCMPQGKAAKVKRLTRHTHPEDWANFVEYARLDIEAMRECHKRMPTWNYKGAELALWHLDQRINDRGVAIDMELVHAAMSAVDEAQVGLAERTVDITEGAVTSTTRRDQLIDHVLEEYGVFMDDTRKSSVERRLDDPDLAPGLRELLGIRLQASSTSTAKYVTLAKGTSADGRLRGVLQFAGAGRTGRWAGRLVQPQNFPRPTLKQHAIDFGIEAMKAGIANLLYPNVMELASSSLRGTIIAPTGKKLVVADLSNIEGRDQAWLAGESWKLQAFRDFDSGTGHDLYKLAYGKSFGVHPGAVTKDQRQIGKVQELALGYQGGVGAFVTFATAYAIDLDELAEKALPIAPAELVAEAEGFYDWIVKQNGNTHGLSRNAFIACDTLKRGWREAHPAISGYWNELQTAVIDAICRPGNTIECRKVKVRVDGAWLRIGLPSGRAICYPAPQLLDEKISYLGVNQYTRKWSRLTTYGGKLFENCIAEGTPVLTDAGWLAIERISQQHRVWDGESWVSHRGLASKGVENVIEAFGVRMTPDHKVLTTEGWINASSCEGYNRASCGLPDGHALPDVGREKVYMERSLRLRRDGADGRERAYEATEARDIGVMRMQAPGVHRGKEYQARHVTPSGLRRLARHVGQVQTAVASSVAKLRRQGHHGVRQLAKIVPELLGRYGGGIRSGPRDRPQGQQRGLLARELPLGDVYDTGEKPQEQPAGGWENRSPTGRGIWVGARHDHLPAGCRGADTEPSRHAGFLAQVYDLIDCGPKHRFTVMGEDGGVLIVHNCCQSVARDVMAHNMPLIEAAGYQIVLTVHDEIIAEAPDSDEFNPDDLSRRLAANPPWALDMPLAAAGFQSLRYKKE